MAKDDVMVNWAIRLSSDQAERWDDLQHALRRETGMRTLTKARLFRALVELADDTDTRAKLIASLTEEE